MRREQKILTGALWGLVVIAMMSIIGASLLRRQRARELEVFAQAPAFSLVDQDEAAVTDQTLRGHPYIADFVFTRCGGPCPVMTDQMAELQRQISDPNVRFVSVSVDPENDTPAVLKAYAKKHQADERRWRFLTGENEAIQKLARGMLISVMPAQGTGPIVHSTKFILVDGAGQIRGWYDSGDAQERTKLVRDVQSLGG